MTGCILLLSGFISSKLFLLMVCIVGGRLGIELVDKFNVFSSALDASFNLEDKALGFVVLGLPSKEEFIEAGRGPEDDN